MCIRDRVNPADKVELPKIEKYSGQFYNQKQIENLIRVVKGDPIEFGVITASFYGLRRSEAVSYTHLLLPRHSGHRGFAADTVGA